MGRKYLKFQQDSDEDKVTENDLAAMENNSEVVDATTIQSNNNQSNSTTIPKHQVSFANLINDPDIKRAVAYLRGCVGWGHTPLQILSVLFLNFKYPFLPIILF